MITVLDAETSFQIVDGKVDPLPFNANNCLVSIGVNDEYYFFNHNHENFDIQSNHKAVQDILNKTTLLVGHNIKFDLVWLNNDKVSSLASLIYENNDEVIAKALVEAICEVPYLALATKKQITETVTSNLELNE